MRCPLLQEALSIKKAHLGYEHRDVAAILKSIGHLHRDQGNGNAAMKMYTDALQIRLDLFGGGIRCVADIKQSMAIVCQRQGETACAV